MPRPHTAACTPYHLYRRNHLNKQPYIIFAMFTVLRYSRNCIRPIESFTNTKKKHILQVNVFHKIVGIHQKAVAWAYMPIVFW